MNSGATADRDAGGGRVTVYATSSSIESKGIIMSRNTHTPAPQVADLGDVEEYVSTAKVAWLQCRSKGHNMTDHDVKFDDEQNVFIVTLRCARCFTKRDEIVNSVTGEVLSAKYHDHPEGYLLPKGTGRMDSQGRGLVRIARLRNSLERKRDLTELTSKRARKTR